MPHPTSMIRIAGLRVQYGSFAAVDGLDLDLYRGRAVRPARPERGRQEHHHPRADRPAAADGGTVTVGGHDVVREWTAIKPLFGYVPDRENHFEEFTGRRNLEFFADLYGVPRAAGRATACELVELRGGRRPAGPRATRSGMRKKLLLARALLHEPPVLYLDEPTANLDIHSARVVHRILRERVTAGHTVLLTTHDMDEVEKICDRVGIMCPRQAGRARLAAGAYASSTPSGRWT